MNPWNQRLTHAETARTDMSENTNHNVNSGQPLSPAQEHIARLLNLDAARLQPSGLLVDRVVRDSGALLEPHPVIRAINRDARAMAAEAEVTGPVEASAALLPGSRGVRPAPPFRHASRVRTRAGFLLAASIAAAFVVGGLILSQKPGAAPDRLVSDDPVETVFEEVRLASVSLISDDADDLDHELDEAASMIAFSDLSFEDVETDLAAIERLLRTQR